MSRFARLANLLPADPIVFLQPAAPRSLESCEGRFLDFAARLGLGSGESASSKKGVALLRELNDGEGGFVLLLLWLLIRMEAILLFQLGELFGFDAGLVGIDSEGGTVVA